MKLVTPDLGLVIWMSLTFLTVLFLLSKFAWKPILKAIRDREKSIEDALGAAEQAKQEIKKMQAGNEQLLREAMSERDQILKAAREAKEQIVAEARLKANEEAERLVAIARDTIRHEKMAAVTELKNQVAILSLEVAEKLIKQQLSSDDKQKELAEKMVAELKMN
jgi:F-type H+-transporting ATPase subunit b